MEQEMERKRKEGGERVSFRDTLYRPQYQTKTDWWKSRYSIWFSLTKSKIKTLLQASIIDSESNSSSKLFTLIYKQTLLDTEPFLLVL